MQRIVIICIALIYFQATPNAARSSELKDAIDYNPENVTKLSINQTAENVTELSINQTAAFEQIVKLTNCSVPRVPGNGGLVCVYFDDNYYCKPMCNQGYDFAFLRRSRLYEECGTKNAFTWTTQYIGGSRLAECIVSDVPVSGQPSAYFNKKTCLEVVSDMKRKREHIDEFISELKKRDIQKDHKKELDFVTCGE
ncbi:uncharacterized protein LOC120909067 isoform X2 [Rana temporaria]|uniref:uncharacterized protein LOC120909067 isoform X2 n=1 Tax=Rana temporaria TaxID=8407 RepID=UPI001AAD9AD9|nr:uncharacterized protein LOC120909067 isoform X2 [Rana temporaria]